MSKSAKKFRGAVFSANDRVLCYEPDPTKARVLYDSKVMDVAYSKEDRGRKAVKYLIHFNGWNRSWDRWVTEEMILEVTKENKLMQKELNEEAKTKSNKRRSSGFGTPSTKRPYGSMGRIGESSSDECDSGSSMTSGSESESTGFSSSDGEELSNSQRRGRRKRQEQRRQQPTRMASRSLNFNDDDDEEEDIFEDPHGPSPRKRHADTSSATDNQAGSNEDYEEIPLDIPVTLREVLKDDCMQVMTYNKLHKLSAVPNISSLLNMWLASLATMDVQNKETVSTSIPSRNQGSCGVKLRNVAPPKSSKIKLKSVTPVVVEPSSQLSLCQEVVSSLKILFDFTVFSNLLYDKERNQYGRLLKRKIPSSLLPVSLSVSSEHSASSKTSSKAAARREHCLPVTKAEVSSATGCPVSDSSYVNRQPAAGGLDAPVSGTESVRSNISYLSAEHSYSRSPEFLVISEAARVLEETELSRKNGTHSSKSRPQDGATILNGTSRINGNSSPCQKAAESKADGNQPRRTRSKSHSLSVKPEPDIDAPIPCVHVTAPPSKTSAGRSSTSGGRASGMPAYCLDAASNVSRHAINFSVRPSDVYGATHLLRLFVFLPTILARMSIGDGRLQVIYEHLYMILSFLNENRQDLLTDVAYHKASGSS